MRQFVPGTISPETFQISSRFLHRGVACDLFLPPPREDSESVHLLLLNDGQNAGELGLAQILAEFNEHHRVAVAAVHAGRDRRMEYGVAARPDYRGRGAKAPAYSSFVLRELLPLLRRKLGKFSIDQIWFAGFSLGGLSAFDIAWNHPEVFRGAGVFSGSFWWRSLDQDDAQYRDEQHRIMHRLVRDGEKREGMRFFFQCGALDETRDRNRNGIIDSIEDTLDLIGELGALGYRGGREIHYLELPDGSHDIPTWSRAFPEFLSWAFAQQ